MSSQRDEFQEIFWDKSILIFLRLFTTILTAYTACAEAQLERGSSLPFLREDTNYNCFKKKVAETIGETEGFPVKKKINFTQIFLIPERLKWKRLHVSVLCKFLGLHYL